MCLAIPALIIEKNGFDGRVKFGEVIRAARFDLIDSATVGDYVLIHAGYAIEVISESEAAETLAVLGENI